MSVTIKWNANT